MSDFDGSGQPPRGVHYYDYYGNMKRPVHVRVDKFTGYGKHVHVTMKEADDPWWDAERRRWVLPSQPEDPGQGLQRVMKFHGSKRARRWIETTFVEEFDPETHELKVEEGESYDWFYGEGD